MNIRRRSRALAAAVRRPPAPALLFVSIVGWAALAWQAAATAAHSDDAALGATLSAHGSHATDAGGSAPHGLALWLAMVVAMSPLLLMREIGRLRSGSLSRRRALTLLAFAGGYGAVWILAGAVAVPLASSLAAAGWLAAGALTVLVWHCSPLRRRLLNVCHRTPRLRVFGAAAIADAGRYGLVAGAACAASCGPIMVLVLLVSDFHLLAMIGAAVLLTTERYRPVRHPRWRLPFAPARPEHVALASRPHGRRESSWQSA